MTTDRTPAPADALLAELQAFLAEVRALDVVERGYQFMGYDRYNHYHGKGGRFESGPDGPIRSEGGGGSNGGGATQRGTGRTRTQTTARIGAPGARAQRGAQGGPAYTRLLPERTRNLPGAPGTREVWWNRHTAQGVNPMHRGQPDVPRIPDAASRVDEHGQRMPFSHGEFDAARTGGQRVNSGNINETSIVRIGRHDYVVKAVEDQGPTQYAISLRDQQRNEAATVAAMRALGLGHLAPSEAYHVVGSDGRRYAVVRVERGTPGGDHSDAEIARRVPEAELRQAVLGEYLLGMRDRHAWNYLYDAGRGPGERGHVKLIDFGFGFHHGAGVQGRDALSDIWHAKAGGRAEWSHEEVGRFLGREGAVRDALSRFDMTSEEMAGVNSRFEALRRLYDSTTGPISYTDLHLAVGTDWGPGMSQSVPTAAP